MMKDKVLIANRGEIAIRITKACEELGIPFVTVYTDEDRESMHVTKTEEDGKNSFRISDYRDPNELFSVADHTGCTAIHPGYGFLAEDYRFARRTTNRERQITFIGPGWESIRDLGSKINTKATARDLNIPTIPGSDRVIYNPEEAEHICEELFEMQERQEIENPSVLVKASAGGGGMGIEQVEDVDSFRRIFRKVRDYSKRYFGDEGVLIEQCMKDFSHVEVQVVGDKKGNLVHYGTRNCSVQSKGRQKRIEVAPGFDSLIDYKFDSNSVLSRLTEDSLRLCRHVNYDNVGTVEWIVTRDGEHYLLEVNTRIQVENDISAGISKIKNQRPNLIKEQIRLALGESLGYKQEDIHFNGTSIEFRIIAEDVEKGFFPQSGIIKKFRYIPHEWLKVYSHLPEKDYTIPSQYDNNLALGVAFGETLEEAKERGRVFLDEIVLDGITYDKKEMKTNLSYLRENIQNLLMFKNGKIR